MRACGPQKQAPRAGGDADAPYLTLRRLAVWLAEPTLRLRTLAALADQARGLTLYPHRRPGAW